MSKQTLSKIFRLVSKIATIVSMVLFSLTIILAPVVIIFGIITLKYIAGLEKGKKPNLTKSILSLFANPTIALLLVVDYFLMKDGEATSSEAEPAKEEVKPQVAQPIVSEAKQAPIIVVTSKSELEGGDISPKKAPKKKNDKKRIAAYAGIIGGLALISVGLFTLSQFEKVKHEESQSVISQAKSKLKKAEKVKKSIDEIDRSKYTEEEVKQLDNNAYVASLHILYWEGVVKDFEQETKNNAAKYVATGLPAYAFSMGTLISVGFVLKHAEKVKEQEEKDV